MREWWHVPTFRGAALKPAKWPNHSMMDAPRRWKKPRVVLVDDIFSDDWRDEDRVRALATIELCPQHLFVLQTRYAAAAKKFITSDVFVARINLECGHHDMSLRNLWLGVHVETQDDADRLIPEILATPAALRFVHATPREGIDFSRRPCPGTSGRNTLTGDFYGVTATNGRVEYTMTVHTEPRLRWLIVEGGADPMHPDHVRSLRDQCIDAGVPFNFAGWGEWHPCTWAEDGPWYPMPGHAPFNAWSAPIFDDDNHGGWNWRRIGKNRSGCTIDGDEHNKFPEVMA